MNIRKISVGNFKSLYSASFEPGKINVFVGANGSGKSTILEAIGLLSAAMTDRVDSASLQRKGVRLSVPSLYKSNFKDLKRKKLTIDLSLEWEDDCCSDQFRYDVHLTPPLPIRITGDTIRKHFPRMAREYGGAVMHPSNRPTAILGFS